MFAAFPTIPGDNNESTMTIYAHVGQHSIADQSYVRDCLAARPAEYAELAKELQAVGYDDLTIVKRVLRSHRLHRRKVIEGRAT